MEMKWLAIMMIGMFVATFVGLGFETHYRQECRVAAFKAAMSVEQIEKVCK